MYVLLYISPHRKFLIYYFKKCSCILIVYSLGHLRNRRTINELVLCFVVLLLGQINSDFTKKSYQTICFYVLSEGIFISVRSLINVEVTHECNVVFLVRIHGSKLVRYIIL